MYALMSSFLKDATGNLCSFLRKVLPSLSEHWWNENIFRNLTSQQQRFVKDRRTSSLSGLDLAALLRVLDKNWYQISERKRIPSDARLYVREMNAIRNRWAHANTEEPQKDDVYRDLDTLQRFARIIEADGKFIERITLAKEKVLLKAFVPQVLEFSPEERRPTRKIIQSTEHATERAKVTPTPRSLGTTRRQRDPELEASLKASVCQLIKNELKESFVPRSDSQFVFSPSGRRYLCKYSSCRRDQFRWFWGVSQRYWGDWSGKDHLVLILENEEQRGRGYSFLLLDPSSSKELLKRCGESNGEKKINMRVYMTSKGEVRLQEWQELPIEDKIKPVLFRSSPVSGRYGT
jgi:hypothetical protein